MQPGDFRIMVFTGDREIACEALEPMMEALMRRTDILTLPKCLQTAVLTWHRKPDGRHTCDDCPEYF